MARNEINRFLLPDAFFTAANKVLTLFSSDFPSLLARLARKGGRVSAEMKKYVSLLLTTADVGCMFKKTPVPLASVWRPGHANASASSRRGPQLTITLTITLRPQIVTDAPSP